MPACLGGASAPDARASTPPPPAEPRTGRTSRTAAEFFEVRAEPHHARAKRLAPHAPRLRDVLRVFVLRRRHPAPVSALRLDWERTSGAPPPAGPSADTGAVKAVAGSSRRRFSSTLVDTRRIPVDAGRAPPGRPSVPAGPSSGAFPPQFSSRPVTFRCENAIISSVENSRRNGPLVRSSAPRAGTRAENLFRS